MLKGTLCKSGIITLLDGATEDQQKKLTIRCNFHNCLSLHPIFFLKIKVKIIIFCGSHYCEITLRCLQTKLRCVLNSSSVLEWRSCPRRGMLQGVSFCLKYSNTCITYSSPFMQSRKMIQSRTFRYDEFPMWRSSFPIICRVIFSCCVTPRSNIAAWISHRVCNMRHKS